jgi:ABC-type multidrug transport system ATPase subunit
LIGPVIIINYIFFKNGAGKSTIFNIFTSLINNTGGTALVKGQNVIERDMRVM